MKIGKIILWIINVLMYIFWNPFRKKNKWIFGAWGGGAYSDNSKYFYEYTLENNKEIDAIWITNNKSVKNKLRSERRKVYLSNEFMGFISRFTCSKVFYTNGMNDVGSVNLCNGAEIIALWHGVPLKKLMYAQDKFKENKTKIIYNKIYSNTQRTKTISTSDLVTSFFIECYDIDKRDVILCGQPRNDILFNGPLRLELKKRFNNLSETNVLFMPTWREFGYDPYIIDFLSLLSKDEVVIDSFLNNSVKLILKLHPRVKVVVPENLSNYIEVVDETNNIDVQELMLLSDALITDYSSAFIDYCLMGKPIFYYIPDVEGYKKNNHELFLDFDDFSSSTIETYNEFRQFLMNYNQYFNLGVENSKMARKLFYDDTTKAGEYSKKLTCLLQ